MYFSGQGKVFVALRDAVTGQPGVFKYLGNVPELTVSLSTDVAEHKESVTGNRITDYRLTRQTKCEVSFALEEFTADSFAMAFYGSKATIAGASVTNEAFPNPVAVGDFVRVKKGLLSAVTVKDSAGSPSTLTLNTHYKINLNHGMVEIVNLASFVQPLKIDYTYASQVNVTAFSQASQERWIRFEGLNTANSSAPMLVEVFRTVLDPMKDFAVLNDDLAKWTLNGSALYDSINVSNSELGGFARLNFLNATGT